MSRTSRTARVRAACALAMIGLGGPSFAQTAGDRPVRRIEVDAGGGLLGGARLSVADANLRANEPTRQSFRLFTADSRFARTPQVHVRTGFAFTRRLGVEAALAFSRPELRTAISADVEGAPPITLTEQVDQYFIDGSLVIMLDELRLGGRFVPFLAGGAGYLRQLHEGQAVVEQGEVYHLGGGAKYWLFARPSGFMRAAGLRTDVRAYLMRGGVSFEDRPRPHVAISGSLFVVF